MQETLKVKEQKLSQKEQLNEKNKKKFKTEPDIHVELKTNYYHMTSTAVDINNNTYNKLKTVVKNLTYHELRKDLDINI